MVNRKQPQIYIYIYIKKRFFWRRVTTRVFGHEYVVINKD